MYLWDIIGVGSLLVSWNLCSSLTSIKLTWIPEMFLQRTKHKTKDLTMSCLSKRHQMHINFVLLNSAIICYCYTLQNELSLIYFTKIAPPQKKPTTTKKQKQKRKQFRNQSFIRQFVENKEKLWLKIKIRTFLSTSLRYQITSWSNYFSYLYTENDLTHDIITSAVFLKPWSLCPAAFPPELNLICYSQREHTCCPTVESFPSDQVGNYAENQSAFFQNDANHLI